MELAIRAEQEVMRQEMLKDNRIEELEAQKHEYNMRTDADYFCEYVIENLMILTKDKQYIDINDVLDALNKECDKYDHTIDVLLDYIKGI